MYHLYGFKIGSGGIFGYSMGFEWVDDVYIYILRDGNIFIRIGYILCGVRSYENYYVH